MKNTHILIFEHDVLKYPPILSVISFLFGQNKKVILIGYCSDQKFIDDFVDKGGLFYPVIENNVSDNFLQKLRKYSNFKTKVNKYLHTFDINDSKVWLFGEQCIWLMHKAVYKYDVNAYLFEIPSFDVALKYKILSLSLNYKNVLQNATKVICCEYNRAHITKSFFQLKELPIVIPNKPNYDSIAIDDSVGDKYLRKYKGKKIILYQGIFNYPERKLDDFCEAIALLPEEYILVLMGGDNSYKQRLKEKYESDRIIFIPHISAPHHLSITKRAYVGILVYNGEGNNIENTLNTLYCAPNKVYEYSRYGIPMISNDVPSLSLMFEKVRCGLSIVNLNVESIRKAFLQIDEGYMKYSSNSSKFCETVNIEELLKCML